MSHPAGTAKAAKAHIGETDTSFAPTTRAGPRRQLPQRASLPLRLVSRLNVSAHRFPLSPGIRNRMCLQHEALRHLGILAARIEDADEMLTRVVRMREKDVQCRVVDVLRGGWGK